MSIVYLANIGNRDVKHISIDNVIPRYSGKEWLDNYDKIKDALVMPIIRSGLEKVKADLGDKKIDKLYLFYTDQPETTPQKHRQSDTIYFAKLIRKIIADKYSDIVSDTVLKKIFGTPNDYDDMYHYYDHAIEEISVNEGIDLAFVAPAGGIPACNMNLIIHGSRFFDIKCQIMLVSDNPDKKTNPPKLLNISSQIIRGHNRKAVEKMANNYNYLGISNLLRLSVKPIDRQLLRLSNYAAARLNLDFETAKKEALALKGCDFIDDQFYDDLVDVCELFIEEQELLPLHSNADKEIKEKQLEMQKCQICEIVLDAIIAYKTGKFTGCVGRMFRIQESLARWFFEFYTGYSSNESNKFQYRDDFKNYGNTSQGRKFKKYLKDKNPNYRYSANRLIFTKFWSYVRKTFKEAEVLKYDDIFQFVKRIDSLGDLRNEAPIAHGFAAVTQTKIDEKYTRGELLKDLFNLPHNLDHKWDMQVFDTISDLIINNY